MIFNTLKQIFLTLFIAFLLGACAKENIIQKPTKDDISGRKIRYVVHIVSSDNIVSKNSISIDSAKVSIVVDGKTQTQVVDSQHFAVFDYLYSGNAIVKIQCNGFTSVGYIVDLRASNDSNAYYDSQNYRIVSTIVTLLPLQSKGTSTIFGNAYAQLDLTTPEFEIAFENLNISATILSNDLKTLVQHSDDGKITNLYYSDVSISSKTKSDGSFQLIVPTTNNGLHYIIRADDFFANQLIIPNVYERKIFSHLPDTIFVFSNAIKLQNIFYQTK